MFKPFVGLIANFPPLGLIFFKLAIIPTSSCSSLSAIFSLCYEVGPTFCRLRLINAVFYTSRLISSFEILAPAGKSPWRRK